MKKPSIQRSLAPDLTTAHHQTSDCGSNHLLSDDQHWGYNADINLAENPVNLSEGPVNSVA